VYLIAYIKAEAVVGSIDPVKSTAHVSQESIEAVHFVLEILAITYAEGGLWPLLVDRYSIVVRTPTTRWLDTIAFNFSRFTEFTAAVLDQRKLFFEDRTGALRYVQRPLPLLARPTTLRRIIEMSIFSVAARDGRVPLLVSFRRRRLHSAVGCHWRCSTI